MKHHIRINPHNDLYNLAYFNVKIVNGKAEDDEVEGIALDCMNCIVSIAFAVEALFNYVGFMKVKGWNEKSNWHKKAQCLFNEVGMPYQEDIDPLRSLILIKNIRNDLAHGKPIEKYVETEGAMDEADSLDAAWEKHCNPEFVSAAFQQAKELRKALFEAYDIKVSQALTGRASVGTLA